MAAEANKRGSSRRKGDEYQDLMALRFALEKYIANTPFKMFLEYEETGKFDDIVLFRGTKIAAYQVKYAVNPLSVYKLRDFTSLDSLVSLKKFSDSWVSIREKYPNHDLSVYLCSNSALDADIVGLVAPDGTFTSEVIEDRKQGKAKQMRLDMKSASGLDADSFRIFLGEFRFLVRQPTLTELEQRIQTDLLDKGLGLSDPAIFLKFKEAIKQKAVSSRDPITRESIDELLREFQKDLIISQVFPVDQDHFVERKDFSKQLDKALSQIDGAYLVVTGLPGSGKSTSLTAYFEKLNQTDFEVFRYYCFVGVNDNDQKIRTRAESFRQNLLSEFQRKYSRILERRFDYSEHNFINSLKTLAEFFVEKGRKLIIFLDGLDHVERLRDEIRDTVISALPANVPSGVVMVVGTQELHQWPYFLKCAKEHPDTHIPIPLFSEFETRNYLEEKRSLSGLSHADIAEVHKKCQGLPLYLRYAAEKILSSDPQPKTIAFLTPATDGDIRTYYELLWEEFEQVNETAFSAKHLCSIMACLRFSVRRDELYSIVRSDLNRPQFDGAYKCISHLVQDSDGRLFVFHNSFREFVISQLPQDLVKGIRISIADFLKVNEDSPEWFGYAFEYCYDVGDYTYILEKVNADFVDRALLHCRPSEEIQNAIHWAVESAFKQQDTVQLSRLGSLKYRTKDRLEYNLDRVLLADVLLALGQKQDVVSFVYSLNEDRLMVDSHTSLAIIPMLADKGQLGLGSKLFGVFKREFQGVRHDEDVLQTVTNIARCLGTYSRQQAYALQWLSKSGLTLSVLEGSDSYTPDDAPHLSAYIDALVQFRSPEEWVWLKRVRSPFPNRLVRYLLIRALAHRGLFDELRVAVEEYIEHEHPCGNVELAFYAARAGISVLEVSAIAGQIKAPGTDCPDRLQRTVLWGYSYSFVILGYEDNESSYSSLYETIDNAPISLWTSTLRHLLKACYCIGQSFRSETNDWYMNACESIDVLVNAKKGEGERIFDSIYLIRDVLKFTIDLLSEAVQKRFPDRLDDWVQKLASLRNSLLWNTHFGISEYILDYSFELSLWEVLAKHSMVRPRLFPILKDCATTYERTALLKGDSRSNHFLKLAAIMARCGMRQDSEKWLRYGVRSSLIYGYHKDITLSYLIEILKLVNQRQPEMALERCSRVLRMVDWMPYLTDGRETMWFTQEAFSVVLSVSRQAAFDLLKHFSKSKSVARWKMENCLEEYLLSTVSGDPEYLWCLSESFSDYREQITRTRKHIVDLVCKSCSKDAQSAFKDRFRHFILTEINPKNWPDQFKTELSIPLDLSGESEAKSDNHRPSDFILDGKTITRASLTQKSKGAFSDFLDLLEKLKAQNQHFYEPELIDEALRDHIVKACSLEDIIPIKQYVESNARWRNQSVFKCLAERFLEFGNQDDAITCFGMAYKNLDHWDMSDREYLVAIAQRNEAVAGKRLLEKCYGSVSGFWNGLNTPLFAATGLDVLDRTIELEAVFNDFLTYCESLFAQLPQNNDYVWLKDYVEPTLDENQLILQFSIEELDTSEIDHGERLIRALTRLAIAQPQSAIPVLVDRALSASGRIFRRLLVVLHALATRRPDLLASHQQRLVKLLDRKDFFCRQSVVRILQCVREILPLEPSIFDAVKRIERAYSTSMSYSAYRMSSSPSPMFLDFLKGSTGSIHSGFFYQTQLMEKILGVQPGCLVAAIEERLNAQSCSIDEERFRTKENWEDNVRPQGWPVIWITTEFQELVTEVLWSILNEVVEKLKLDHDQIHWLWQTSQMADPEYVLREVMVRPVDIKPLHVVNGEVWFQELGTMESFQVGNADNIDWITIFEMKKLAYEERLDAFYEQTVLLKSALIPLQVYGGLHELEELEWVTEPIVPASNMTVTLEQARDVLTKRGLSALRVRNGCIPLVAEHQNPVSFFGYMSVCTLTSFVIDEFNLSFKGFDLVRDGNVVARYEVWQEGYLNQEYVREKLSFGIRLRARCDFIAEVCRRYKKILCVRTNERRKHYKSIHSKEPNTKKDSRRYMIYHL